jgi:hypothetical protein
MYMNHKASKFEVMKLLKYGTIYSNSYFPTLRHFKYSKN